MPTDRPLASWIRELESQGKLYTFYKTPEWRALKAQVMRDHGNECEACAAKGKYTRADTVHHEKEVRKFPGLALTRWMQGPDGAPREVLHLEELKGLEGDAEAWKRKLDTIIETLKD